MGLTGVLLRGTQWLEDAIGLLCNAVMLVTGLSILVLLNCVALMRYAFGSGFAFAPDLTELLFAIFVTAGIVQAARLGVHVATQLLMNLLSPEGRRVLAVVIHAVSAAAYVLLAWYALQNAIIAHVQKTPVLEIPWSVGYGTLAVGLAMVALCSLLAIVKLVVGHEAVKVDLADAGAAAI